jgi:hypothetical protein
LFSFFKGNKEKFSEFNTDKRCKIIPSNFFCDNIDTNWVIDKLWSEKEKIELGIVERNESMSLFDFSSAIDEISDTLKEFSREGKELAEKKKPFKNVEKYKLRDLFDIEKGIAKYTRKYGNLNKGDFPVYSASNNEPLTFINTFDYDGEFLTWATNGFAGYTKVVSGKFCINGDRGLLKPKKDNIVITYVKYRIEPVLRNLAKGRKGENGEDEFTKVYPSMIKDIEILMPINNEGFFDVATQMQIAQKYEFVDDVKKKIADYKQQIDTLNIEIECTNKVNQVKVMEIFDLDKKTNNSLFTKSFIEKHKGNIPVFSASKYPDTIDYGYVLDNLPQIKYFENCLTWNIDGSIGKAHYRQGRFSLSEKVIPLVLQEKYKEKLDVFFLKYIIEATFNKQRFNFSNKAGKSKIKDILLDIPIDEFGGFDLFAQRKIAEKYNKVEQLKSTVSKELERIKNIIIDII